MDGERLSIGASKRGSAGDTSVNKIPDAPMLRGSDAATPVPRLRGSDAPATPLMQQYHALKARYPEEVLLFRLGDFYELFAHDAERAAPILDVALTHRQQTPMCGVPFHAVDAYIAKLLKAGLRVAIAEQMEDPAATKGLVRRDIVRVMTPGTLQEDSLLAAKRCNFLVALVGDALTTGVAALESSTGEFMATQIPTASTLLWDELVRLNPSEVVVSTTTDPALCARLKKAGIAMVVLPALDTTLRLAEESLKKRFGTASLRGFGLEGKPHATAAAGAALRYLENTQCGRAFTVEPLRTYALDDFLQMDASTLDHLDLLSMEGAGNRSPKTLLDVLDETRTPMGGRLLRRWLVAPLRNLAAIHERQSQVERWVKGRETRRALRQALQGWPDFERILARLSAKALLPRDLAHLATGLKRLPDLKALGATDTPQEPVLAERLSHALVDGPPASMKDGGVIRAGFSGELDEVRSWIHDGKSRLLELEGRERETTGIGSLKISFTNIFGYYIEVTRTHLSRVPAHYIRKQTTANGERYITSELKEFETRILGAEDRALRLETALLQSLREEILKREDGLRAIARSVAQLDVFLSLAETADTRGYVKPRVDGSDVLNIREGRHPVLEAVLPSGTLVSNDIELDGRERQIVVLTGPNMSGKSTYLRQTALIVILAQMGSYVPAADAQIGVLDQLFTRIGAADRLAEGESTFMVEMVETARILHHATAKSLVILDEVGRGTSTYDGIAIAWACVEHLNGSTEKRVLSTENAELTTPRSALRTQKSAGPKVLFATHYFELTQLAARLPGVHNAHVTAREWGDAVVFLHKVEPGPADRAYGIHVARLAGVPRAVLERAKVLLQTLEERNTPPAPLSAPELPLNFSAPLVESPSERLAQELAAIDIETLRPVDALLKLQELKNKLNSPRGDMNDDTHR